LKGCLVNKIIPFFMNDKGCTQRTEPGAMRNNKLKASCKTGMNFDPLPASGVRGTGKIPEAGFQNALDILFPYVLHSNPSL
jgi:hypothetical protein